MRYSNTVVGQFGDFKRPTVTTTFSNQMRKAAQPSHFGSWLSDATGINVDLTGTATAAGQQAASGALSNVLSQPGVQTAAGQAAQAGIATQIGQWVVKNPMYVVLGLATLVGVGVLIARK